MQARSSGFGTREHAQQSSAVHDDVTVGPVEGPRPRSRCDPAGHATNCRDAGVAASPGGYRRGVPTPATLSEVSTAIREVLADGCARDEHGLVVELRRRGLELGVEATETVAEVLNDDEMGLVLPLGDGRTCCSRRCSWAGHSRIV